MRQSNFSFITCTFSMLCMLIASRVTAQQQNTNPSAVAITSRTGSLVQTYVNPILPGDHPDPTLLKAGNDFYMCGSSFHFVPNVPILHSRDLLHWEIIARVVPADWQDLKSGAPGAGIWQGALTYFYGQYHIYFSNGSGGGQYFSTAEKPSGPWSKPIKVQGTPDTGPTGYDNSVFVDDDGTPYMVIKPGQTQNRLQQIGHDGHLMGKLINMDWINRDKKYSWAEGPVMCKRNGWYYYFMAGDVTGGQYVLRSKTLTGDSTQWQNMGSIFAFSKDPQNRFRSVNHMSAPLQLNDGTWWCIAQSYDVPVGDDWSGQGRQDLLLQIQWTADGRPYVTYPSDQPLQRPRLSGYGLHWCLPVSDYFSANTLKLAWHFLNKQSASQYSITDRPGWLRLKPQEGPSHILQKEGGHSYALVTRVNIDADAQGQQAGIYITSGNETENVKLFCGNDHGKEIGFVMGKQAFTTKNTIGNTVWLKLERYGHQLSGYYSRDGVSWLKIGNAIDATELDKAQPNFNAWVGTSIGLFATGKEADFDFFIYKDGFSNLPAEGCNNYYGVKLSHNGAVINTGAGGWIMLGGVEIGNPEKEARTISLTAAAKKQCKIEVWVDDLAGRGRLLKSITINPTGGLDRWKTFSAKIPSVTGQHDVYLKMIGAKDDLALKSLKFD